MASLKVVGIDGALNNFGVAIGTLNTNSNAVDINAIHLISYSRNKKMAKSMADLERIAKINKALKRHIRGADVICAELLSGSQSSAAAWSLGITLGILGSLNRDIIWVTPRQAKNVTGNPRASKDEVIAWAIKKYPDLKWHYWNGRLTAKNEHMADACAILISGLLKGKLIKFT